MPRSKPSQKLTLYRRRNKKLAYKSQTLQATCAQLKTENEEILARVAALEDAAIRNIKRRGRRAETSDKPMPSSKPKTRKKGLFFIGLAAGIIIALLTVFLADRITLNLDIPPGGVNGIITLSGSPIAPGDFLSNTNESPDEMAGITARFLDPQAVDFYQAGMQEVTLMLQNGRRIGEASVILNIIDPELYFQLEAGVPSSYITPEFFVPTESVMTSDVALDVVIHSGLPAGGIFTVGLHVFSVSVNGVFFHPQVNVIDTTPPTATLRDITIPAGEDIEPEDFIIEIFDMSPVVDIWFVNEPDTFAPGEQTVDIGIEDYFGNQAVYSVALTVLNNTVPPQIFGTQDIYVQIGSPIIFRMGVRAEDAFGRPLEFFVDSSEVNIHELGTYRVIYYTVDPWGLRAEAEIYVIVMDVDPERVWEMGQAVLDNILQEGMTQVEQARAIFDWIQNNVAYAANISRGNVYEGAYQAMRNRRGDCFVFYSISEVLLTLAGIPNMHIQRIPGTPTRHSWNLINPDGLGWHHFDATPMMPVHNQRLNRFMFTSSEAREHTWLIQQALGTQDYYTYDPARYPDNVQ